MTKKLILEKKEIHITSYLKSLSALYSQGISTEHSFRGALETLLKNMTGFAVVNEARHIACGAPDLTLLKNKIPAGYIEAKDIGKNLNSKDYKNQFDRYKKALDNLIITDYLTFQLFEGEVLVSEISIGKITTTNHSKGGEYGAVTPITDNFNKFIELIRIFSGYNGKPIANSVQLAEFMAAKTQLLAEVIEKTLADGSPLTAQLQGFQKVLLPTMDNAQFADMYAQTIAYGMFVARLQDNLDAVFTRQQAANLIPKSNPFLRKLFQYIAGYDIDENIRWIVDSLADMFNYVDMDAIRREFESKDKDPFLHFYEDFLTRYDKRLKNVKGAYYTPSAVVKFIVRAVDDILKSDFGIVNGLADNSFLADSWNLTPDPSPKERGEIAQHRLEPDYINELSSNERVGMPFHTVAEAKLWSNLLQKAKEGRKNPTEAENLMWQKLRNKKLEYKFRRQHPIGEFIPDFVCLEKKLVVEIDGDYHNEEEQTEYDNMRSRYLNEYSYDIVRFTNEEILTDISAVLQKIKKRLSQPTSPLSFGEDTKFQETRFHKVQILDPATGTGTFLAEVVRNIYQKFENNAGMWNDYVSNHLIPRLNGFEIMMSPYTMAHLKIETILQEFGYVTNNNNRLHIYLTDSLENPKQNVQQIPFVQWLSNEATEAAKIKNNTPVMVILGNPPYSGISQNKGEWITNLIEDYKYIDGIHFNEKKHWLQDDYVKFIRFGQYFIEKNGEGVLAYINNHGFLDNPTFRGMRYSLLQTFDKIYIIDLHGNVKKREIAPDGGKDENVFDIQQGVSINIFVKNFPALKKNLATVFHADLYGRRQEKYSFLSENNLQSIAWTEIKPEKPFFFFVQKSNDNKEEYEKGFAVNEIFNLNVTGIVTMGDSFIIDDDKNKLKQKITKLIRNEYSEEQLNIEFGLGKNYAKWILKNRNFIKIDDAKFIEIAYRPFDSKWTYFDNKLIWRWRIEVMQHYVKGDNIGLVTIRRSRSLNDWNFVFVCDKIISGSTTISSLDINYVFPLYLYQEQFGKTERIVNMNAAIVAKIRAIVASSVGAGFKSATTAVSSEQIFDYIYAVLHSPSYRERYKEFLKIDFPRVPYPKDAAQFEKLAALGERLRRLHLMKPSPTLSKEEIFANFPKSGSNKIEKPEYSAGKVWINNIQYFDNVPEITWNFYIGGYQPAQKWLKDRRGRTLSYEDIEHYQKIILVLTETDRIMKEIEQYLKC